MTGASVSRLRYVLLNQMGFDVNNCHTAAAPVLTICPDRRDSQRIGHLRQSGGFIQAQHNVHVLHRLSGSAFYQVVDG